ncbi:hypothetical protein HY11_11270 [Hyphomonas pacifica]|nr:hypothetical protein HY11_11270 [Hyphomonas pacifica]
MAAMAASLLYSGAAHAEPAVYFNEDANVGIQRFKDTVDAADAAYNAANPGSTRTSLIYEYDILSTSGSSFMVIGPNAGDPSVIVETTQAGNQANNAGTGREGGDGFTNWSNSYSGGFAGAEAMGYTYKFFETDGTTPFDMNAIGTMVNDWGTCCTTNNATPSGGSADASEVYLRFGNSDPLLLGGISNRISSQEHFIGAINDTNFFNEVTVIANGQGEFFGVGGYLIFSSVALNSVPEGSSDVDDSLGGGTTIPDIDTASTYYTGGNLADGAVNPNFVGGTLMFGMNTSVNTSFTVQSQGGTIDTEKNIVVVHGDFTGAGGMKKTGSGLLVLSGTNTQSGGFTVSEGTLQASRDSNLGGGPLTIGNARFQAGGSFNSNRQLIVQHQNSVFDLQDNSVLWQGAVTGNGALNLTGSGHMYLTGANTYTGGTTLTGGMLTGNTTSIQGDVVNGGTVEFVQDTTGTYSGAMSGTGGLVHTGSGRLVLTGANTYTGGTRVMNGVLAGNTTSLQGNIENDGIIDFVQDTTGTYSGAMSGTGGLVHSGSGRLVLTGNNSYAGGTLVGPGTLVGTTSSIQGDIFNNGMVEFAQSASGTFSGAMTGTGGLRKLGAGMLMLTGNSQITGSSYVDEGTLSVNGVFGSNMLTVANGATLKGVGGINGGIMVLSGGELSPGNSPGTLYVSGDVTLNEGSIFLTEIDGNVYSVAGGAGSYDRLVLTGEGATFTAAGSINPILRGISGDANNNYTPVMGDIFTVVTADSVVGTFNDIVQPTSGLAANTRLKVIYNDDSVQLALVANSLGMAAMDGTMGGNAVITGLTIDYATANGQNASGELSDLLDRFDGLNETQVARATGSLSGDMHAHIIESAESVLGGSDDMIISAARGDRGVGGLSTQLDNGIRLWTRAEARGASYDPDGYTWGFDEDVYGITVGATLLNKEGMKAGIAGSYKTVELYNDTADGATNHMLSLYGYGSRAVTTRLTLSGLVGYTNASAKVSRTTELGTIVSHSRAKQDIKVLHAQAEARYKVLERGGTSAYAIAGVRTAISNVDAYDEQGDLDFTQLSVGGESRSTLQSKLGAEIAHTVAKTDFALFGNWTRDLGANPRVKREVSLGNAIWQTVSVNRGLDTYNYGVRASRDVTDRIGVEIEYTGRYNSPNYDAQQLMIGVNVAW